MNLVLLVLFSSVLFSSLLEIVVHLAVAGGVYDGIFCAALFPRDVLDEILDLIESVSEAFPTC